jgi:hypothetical protein
VGLSGGRQTSQYNPGMPETTSIDVLLATLNATDVGSLDAIAEKMMQVKEGLSTLGEDGLAGAAADAVTALRRGDVSEFRRGRAFLQSKIGHLR